MKLKAQVMRLSLVAVGVLVLLTTASSSTAATAVDCSVAQLFRACVLFNTGGEIEDIALSPDDNTVAVVGQFLRARIMSIPSGELLMESPDPRVRGYSLDFSPDGQILAIATLNGLSFWNLQTDTTSSFETELPARSVRFFPDGDRVVFSTDARDISIFDLNTQEVVASVEDNNFPFAGSVRNLSVSPDGQLVGSNSLSGSKLWAAEDLSLVHHFSDPQNAEIGEIDFSPNGLLFAHSIAATEVPIRDLSTDSFSAIRRLQLEGSGERGASGPVFFGDSNRIAISSFEYDLDEPAVRIWDLSTGTGARDLIGVGRTTVDLRLTNNEQFLLGVSGSDGNNELHNVLIWHIE